MGLPGEAGWHCSAADLEDLLLSGNGLPLPGSSMNSCIQAAVTGFTASPQHSWGRGFGGELGAESGKEKGTAFLYLGGSFHVGQPWQSVPSSGRGGVVGCLEQAWKCWDNGQTLPACTVI